jgi:hypothetical protein
MASLVTFQSASGQDKSVDVHFDTADGVKIEGSFWAPKDGKKAPVAMLLHDFSKKGGNCHDDGWDGLAAALNAKGFAVLQFDFRGFGKSTSISNPMFWTQPHNRAGVKVMVNPTKPPESIDKATFTPFYYPVLANDVAAAKAFLDRKNDGGELNVSNLVVIGAGQGAAIGELWLASECHKKHGTPPGGVVGPVLNPALIKFEQNYEGKDVRAAVWLSISSSIEGRALPVKQWFLDTAGKMHKIPTVLLYGKEDKAGDERALTYMKALSSSYARGKPDKDYPLSGDFPVEKGTATLAGSKLLQKGLDTQNWIVNLYLGSEDMAKSLKEEWRDRDSAKSKQYWLFLPTVLPAKTENDLMLIPLARFGVPN